MMLFLICLTWPTGMVSGSSCFCYGQTAVVVVLGAFTVYYDKQAEAYNLFSPTVSLKQEP